MIVRLLLCVVLFSCAARSWSQGCTAIQVGDQCLPPEVVYPHMNDPLPPRPPAPVKPTKPLFGAIAKDNLNRLSWAVNYKSDKDAMAASLQSCEKRGGQGCQTVEFKNTCRALAIDAQGKVSIADDELWPETAARFALEACDQSNPTGGCRLMALPICSSPILPVQRVAMINGAADSATTANIDDLAAKVHPREHWVTLAAGQSQVVYASVGQVNGSSAERDALAQCNAKDSGCQVIQSANDSCVAAGFLKKPAPSNYERQSFFGSDPAKVAEEVKRRCKDYGVCGKITVRCAGMKYPKAAPFEPNSTMTGLGATPGQR
jgi:Domain of unknown function (DUF4189)